MKELIPGKGITARPEVIPTEDQRLRQKSLPELELRELQKSEKPINEIENKKVKVESVRPWNNYTVVTLEGSDEIMIFDEDARVIPEFKKPLSSKKVTVNWNSSEVKNKLGQGKEYIGDDTKSNNDTQNISKVPLELRGFAKAVLGAKGEFNLERATMREFTARDVIILDKYIILTTKDGGYFAYVTRNENGVVLAPQDWQRIDYIKPIPSELNKYVERILGENEGYKQVNVKYPFFRQVVSPRFPG